MNEIHCIIFIVLFIILCVIIKRTSNNTNKINRFQDNLNTSELNTQIDNLVRQIISEKFKNFKINKNTGNVSNLINILENDSPLGHISYFFNKPSSEHWLPCDGRVIYSDQYPEFFEIINKNITIDQKTQIKLPNLVGRMIVGAGIISKTEGDSTAELTNNKNIYNISQDVEQDGHNVAFRAFTDDITSINLKSGETSGFDHCNNLISVKGDASSNIKVCNSKSNMPPHINLPAYIKVKHDYFDVVY